jgi:hypothetical protein
MPQLSTGAAAAEEMANEGRTSGNRSFIPDMKFKNNEVYFLRPVTDHKDWVSILVHSFIPRKARPAELDEKAKWADTMWGICQGDKAFRLRDGSGQIIEPAAFEPGYGECYIDTAPQYAGVSQGFTKDLSKPKRRVYGIFAECEPVKEDGTVAAPGERGVRFREKLMEWKDSSGETVTVPALVLVNQAWDNFYGAVKAASYMGPDTVCDKVFTIKRTDMDYTIVPAWTDPEWASGKLAQTFADSLKVIGFDMCEYLLAHATPDHYARYFVPGVVPEGGYGRRKDSKDGEDSGQESAAGTAAASATTPVTPDVDPALQASFRARLENRGTATETAPAAQ